MPVGMPIDYSLCLKIIIDFFQFIRNLAIIEIKILSEFNKFAFLVFFSEYSIALEAI